MKPVFPKLLAVLIILFSAQSFAQELVRTYTVKGEVIDAQTEKPLTDIIVSTTGLSGTCYDTTDADGKFVLNLSATPSDTLLINTAYATYESYDYRYSLYPVKLLLMKWIADRQLVLYRKLRKTAAVEESKYVCPGRSHDYGVRDASKIGNSTIDYCTMRMGYIRTYDGTLIK